ncbi:MAG: DUF2934 domain-containing protein [Acidobacteriota bacterium]
MPRASRRVASTAVPSEDDIARRAYEIFLARSADGGDSTTDWLQAERELTAPAGKRRRRVSATA